ncbi:hypothetical protein FS842_003399 [Serendipita sp. 407]|nr:hypothetical protein FS842_003399 [Serendipita sp. 407]
MSTPQPVLPLSVARLAQSAPPRPLAPNENDIGLKLVSMPGSPYPYKVPHFREDTPDATSYPGGDPYDIRMLGVEYVVLFHTE